MKPREDSNDYWSYTTKQSWFHNWMLKVLLERVTAFCARRSIAEHGHARKAAITIARRGGFYHGDFEEYLKVEADRHQDQSGVLPYYLDWRVVDLKQITVAPAANVPGLQLADIVCGAFLHAVDLQRFGRCDTQFAEALHKRMATDQFGHFHNCGVTAWPKPLSKAGLAPEQLDIFRSYGFPDNKLVRPGPRTARR